MRTEHQTQQYPNRTNYPDIKDILRGKENESKENENKVEPEEREHIVDDEGVQVNPSDDNHNGGREHLIDDDDIPAGLSPA